MHYAADGSLTPLKAELLCSWFVARAALPRGLRLPGVLFDVWLAQLSVVTCAAQHVLFANGCAICSLISTRNPSPHNGQKPSSKNGLNEGLAVAVLRSVMSDHALIHGKPC
jgi:hypothetical protein